MINPTTPSPLSAVAVSDLERAQRAVCSLHCPSVKRTGEPWTHVPLCQSLLTALAGETPAAQAPAKPTAAVGYCDFCEQPMPIGSGTTLMSRTAAGLVACAACAAPKSSPLPAREALAPLTQADYDETVDIAFRVVEEIFASPRGAAGYLSAVLQQERTRERRLAIAAREALVQVIENRGMDTRLTPAELLAAHEAVANDLATWINETSRALGVKATDLHPVYTAHVLLCEFVRAEADRLAALSSPSPSGTPVKAD